MLGHDLRGSLEKLSVKLICSVSLHIIAQNQPWSFESGHKVAVLHDLNELGAAQAQELVVQGHNLTGSLETVRVKLIRRIVCASLEISASTPLVPLLRERWLELLAGNMYYDGSDLALAYVQGRDAQSRRENPKADPHEY